MKIAFFDYHALGNSAATACAALMIVGSLVALWIESVVPYVLTAARTTDVGDAQSLVRLPGRAYVNFRRGAYHASLLVCAQLAGSFDKAVETTGEDKTGKLLELDAQDAAEGHSVSVAGAQYLSALATA